MNERPACELQIMQVTSRCTTFTGQNDSEDWLAHISAVESDVAVLQSFSGDFIAEEVMCTLVTVLQGMIIRGRQEDTGQSWDQSPLQRNQQMVKMAHHWTKL